MASFIYALSIFILVLSNGCFTLPIDNEQLSSSTFSSLNGAYTVKPQSHTPLVSGADAISVPKESEMSSVVHNSTEQKFVRALQAFDALYTEQPFTSASEQSPVQGQHHHFESASQGAPVHKRGYQYNSEAGSETDSGSQNDQATSGPMTDNSANAGASDSGSQQYNSKRNYQYSSDAGSDNGSQQDAVSATPSETENKDAGASDSGSQQYNSKRNYQYNSEAGGDNGSQQDAVSAAPSETENKDAGASDSGSQQYNSKRNYQYSSDAGSDNGSQQDAVSATSSETENTNAGASDSGSQQYNSKRAINGDFTATDASPSTSSSTGSSTDLPQNGQEQEKSTAQMPGMAKQTTTKSNNQLGGDIPKAVPISNAEYDQVAKGFPALPDDFAVLDNNNTLIVTTPGTKLPQSSMNNVTQEVPLNQGQKSSQPKKKE